MQTDFQMSLNDVIARAVAIGGLVAIALIHMLQLPEAFAAIGYLGALFVAAVTTCVVVAAVMTRTSDDRTLGRRPVESHL